MRVDQDVAMDPSISGLVAEYIVAIEVTRVRFPADAISSIQPCCSGERDNCSKGMLALHLPGVCYSYVAMVSGPVAMDKALVFGTKDCRFESCPGPGAVVLLSPRTQLSRTARSARSALGQEGSPTVGLKCGTG